MKYAIGWVDSTGVRIERWYYKYGDNLLIVHHALQATKLTREEANQALMEIERKKLWHLGYPTPKVYPQIFIRGSDSHLYLDKPEAQSCG